ncbi:hypothetical protein TNCV_5018671 [Trichonephila clavipes]|nr:hypothetical protein TNCV_5018671 [Trichonephila clavipes]
MKNKLKPLSMIMRLQTNYLKNVATFCSRAAVSVQDPFPHFRTTENNPLVMMLDQQKPMDEISAVCSEAFLLEPTWYGVSTDPVSDIDFALLRTIPDVLFFNDVGMFNS